MFETITILISILLLMGLFFVSYHRMQTKSRKKNLQQKLQDIIIERQLNPTFIDQLQHQVLAIDPDQKKLIHITDKKANIIDLRHIQSCNLIFKVLMIQLELVYHQDRVDDSCTIVFFRKYIDKKSTRRSLTRKAKKWEARIAENLTVTQYLKPAQQSYEPVNLSRLKLEMS